MRNGKICYIEIPAIDINASAGFYQAVFGWRTRQRGDGQLAFDDGVEVSGTWVLVGLWLYKNSKPDLNCQGLNRGRKLEWVIVAKGYSIEFDSIGDEPERRPRKDDRSAI